MRQSNAHQPGACALETRQMSIYYSDFRAVKEINLAVQPQKITALIGPSGCGKSTVLRAFNRMNDLIPGARVEGEVLFHHRNLYDPSVDVVEVRRSIGMVFQKPNPFPKSIYDNIAFGPKINGWRGVKAELDELVEQCLRRAALWHEVRDKLKQSALSLSGGQQQRLCLARTLAPGPEVVLLDEPTASLDPISTQKVEELVYELRRDICVVIVTHNMQQAARVSDYTAFFLAGELVEMADTEQLFTAPADERTEAYVTGRFG
jgi:phosphate transport system ATP-binding protein